MLPFDLTVSGPARAFGFLLLCGLLGLCPEFAFAQTGEAPNVLFIVADDLNDFTGYTEGHPELHTPNLDRLTARGIRFTNAYCNAPVCNASRTSFLTGKRPIYTGSLNNSLNNPMERRFRHRFRPDLGNETVFTIPEVFREAGYYTHGINKIFHGWTKNFHDNDFDTINPRCAKGLSWESFFDFNTDSQPTPPGPSYGEGVPSYPFAQLDNSEEPNMIDTRVADSAIAFLDRYAANPAAFCDRPFFLAVGFRRPHGPHFVPERFFQSDYTTDYNAVPFNRPYNSPANAWPPNGVIPSPRQLQPYAALDSLPQLAKRLALGSLADSAFMQAWALFPSLPTIESGISSDSARAVIADAKRAQALMAYLASVRFMDYQAGRIMDVLESHPELYSNTIVVFISDHGFSLGENRHWGKFTPWETEMRIPMVFADPRRPGGRESRATVDLLDLFPTMLDLAGLDAPSFPDGSRYLDGRSLLPYWSGPNRDGGHPVLLTLQLEDSYGDGYCEPSHAVRDERYRFIRLERNTTIDCIPGTTVPEDLSYDLGPARNIDPHEWSELGGSAAGQAIRSRLIEHLPGGLFYGPRPEHGARIQRSALPCRFDTLTPGTLQVAVPLSGPYRYHWVGQGLTPGSGTSYTPSPIGAWASLEPLIVELRVEDTLAGTTAVDRITLSWEAPPNAAFNLVADGPRGARVSGFDPLASTASIHWQWSDSVSAAALAGSSSPRRQFSSSGSYTLTNRIAYGHDPDGLCIATESRSIAIADAAFAADTCATPTPGAVAAVGPNAIDFHWPDAQGAASWRFAYRSTEEPGLLWTRISTSNRHLRLSGLEEGHRFEWRLKANCTSYNSPWSTATPVRTSDCPAPHYVRAFPRRRGTMRIRWKNAAESSAGTRLRLEGPGILLDTLLTGGSTFFEADSLLPASLYTLRLNGLCPSLPGEPVAIGDKPFQKSYLIPGARDWAEPEAGFASGEGLIVWPNPSGGQAQVEWTSALQSSSTKLPPPSSDLLIYDAMGRLLLRAASSEAQWNLDGSFQKAVWQLGDLPQGFYLLRIEDRPEHSVLVVE